MPVTIADLVADPALHVLLRTGPTVPTGRPVSWVHVSELDDPTPFLQGGELLLTTGLALRQGTPVRDYVRRLVEAGVVGLGLGTGLSHAVVPADLLAAAVDGGLALLEVPRETPFIALSRTVSAALAADEYAAVTRSATAQQELARAALAPGAPATVLERLARQIGGWAVLVDAGGSPLEAVPVSAARRVPALRAELDRLRGLRAPAAAALTGPEETVLLQSLGHGSRSRGVLAVGRPGPMPAADRHVVNAAALVLSLRLEQSRALDSAMAALRAGLLRLLLAGEDATVGAVVEELGQQLPAEPLHVLTVLGSAGQRAAAVDVAADAAAHQHAALFSAELDGALVLLVPAVGRRPVGPAPVGPAPVGPAPVGPAPVDAADLAARVPGAAVGTAGPTPWARLTEGVQQSRLAAEHARARGGGATGFPELAAPGLAALLDPAATRAFAESLLAPLRAADRDGAGDLVRSVRVWLSHHGQWEPAAVQLGVHRHTLRKRVHRAQQLLGRDLDEPGTRAELWLALHPPA